MAEAGNANYLVSGDRRGVLALGTHGITQILRAREFLDVLGIKPIAVSSAPLGNKPG
jgi:predicted nucleic acid-binding protein